MRVITGKYKGRKLFAPEDDKEMRPTGDRNKEAIFSILSSLNAVSGSDVLDLFCGTGGLGIESLSRGAASVVFVDSSHSAIKLTRQNLEKLSIKQEGQVYQADYRLATRKLKDRRFDLIIADPPYSLDPYEVVELIDKYGLIKEGGYVLIEHSAQKNLQNATGGYIIDQRTHGITGITVLKKKPEKEENAE